ncbi:uncharacterized protein EV154DRAFT_500290 [Mucor mucedo]|uniref:uncharacterized protein n=1 Tax=Mucor mucedo TaxID=29922 RepID=UPI00221FD829|nr:uncharacterized protein EV154DRAFT_500290 [Mucor mucedo]KAI7893865.1 hypothetical protein EV154DRAFT_500290 [Mucor mucedo]
MSLSDFLADDTTGGSSWADDVADLPSAPAGNSDRSDAYASRGFGGGNDRSGGFGGGDRYGGERREGGFERREGGFERREGGFEREQRTYAPRAPVELPTQPPYTAHIANLSFDSTEDDLSDLFTNLKIQKIRLLRDRETDRSKGFGYIEFDDLESLKRALELNGENVQGRSIRVNIAEPPKNDERTRGPDRTDVDTWRRTGPIDLPEQPRREFREGGRGGFGGRGDSSWGARSGGDSFGSRDRPSERPRLNLKPRTVETVSATPAKSSGKPDPFGGARPVDTDKALHDIEKKHDEPTK